MSDQHSSRRTFIKKIAGTAIASGFAPSLLGASRVMTLPEQQFSSQRYGANDQVNVALIGMGIMGFSNAHWTSQIPGVKIVGVCDLYTGRLDRAKEKFGKDLFVTKNYKEILDRKDVDAVIISTSDHWHDRISIEAMNKGKHVYCEKPMVHHIEEAQDVIATQKKTGKVFQVGSQRVSSIITQKTKELFEQKVIGDLIMVETWMDRHSANGAWQYSIPTDANANTVDWNSFLGDAPHIPYDPVRFFRWRNYQDYGTGVAGDLFVHLFSGLHTVTSSHGPERVLATGGLRYWKDGRDVPDIILGIYDYPSTDKHPAFNLQMRVNFVDGSEIGEGLRLVGTDGVIDMGWDSVKIKRHKVETEPGYGGWDSFDTFTEAQQKEYKKWYEAKYPKAKPTVIDSDLEYKVPENYSANYDHHAAFYRGIREGAPIAEDALFGIRAAGPALATNKSTLEKKIVMWDAENGRLA